MPETNKKAVWLFTQGTYPFYQGGVSTWCDELISGLNDRCDFKVYSLTGSHNGSRYYTNHNQVCHIPLWGANDLENLSGRTAKAKPEAKHLSVFTEALSELLECISAFDLKKDDAEAGYILYRLYKYFEEFSWHHTWNAKDVWQHLIRKISEPQNESLLHGKISIYDFMQCISLLKHYLIPLLIPLPHDDNVIIHNTCANLSGLTGILAKVRERIEIGSRPTSQTVRNPYILTEHGVYIKEQYIYIEQDKSLSALQKQFITRWNILLCKLNYMYADRICPVADAHRGWEINYGARPYTIQTINNGVRLPETSKDQNPAQRENRVVAVVSRVVRAKDVVTIIRAADRYISYNSNLNISFEIYGDLDVEPDYVAHCYREIKERKLENYVKLCGSKSNEYLLKEVYPKAKVFALTSRTEGFPISILEAMASGLPVIATRVGGIPEIVDESCGILISVGDVGALYAALKWMLGKDAPEDNADHITEMQVSDQDRWIKLGEAARNKIKNAYQIEHILLKYDQLYGSLLQNPSSHHGEAKVAE